MNFRQKNWRYRATFEFGEEELTYSFEDARVKVGSSVPYHKLPGRMNTREVKSWWLRYVGVFTLLVCAICTLHYLNVNDLPALAYILYGVMLFFVMACFFAFFFRYGRITSFHLDPVMVVLHDGQEKTILVEIARRRTEMMHRKLAQVDFNRPYFEEARKFRALREEEIVSEQEYLAARQKIGVMRDKNLLAVPPVPGSLN